MPFGQTQLGRLVAETSAAQRAAVAAWVHESLFTTHRCKVDRRTSLLTGASWALRQQGVVWAAEVVGGTLHRAQGMMTDRPAGGEALIKLPQSALTALGPDERVRLAGLLRWYADHADLRRSWPDAAGLRRWFEQSLPPQPDSPDPYHAFTDACPLADKFRVRLTGTLDRRGVLKVLQHCDHPPPAPKDEPAWQDTLTEHLAAEPRAVQVLRTIAEAAAERPYCFPLCRHWGSGTRPRPWRNSNGSTPPRISAARSRTPAYAANPQCARTGVGEDSLADVRGW